MGMSELKFVEGYSLGQCHTANRHPFWQQNQCFSVLPSSCQKVLSHINSLNEKNVLKWIKNVKKTEITNLVCDITSKQHRTNLDI